MCNTVIRTFIRHKDRQYKIETETKTEGIKTRLKMPNVCEEANLVY